MNKVYIKFLTRYLGKDKARVAFLVRRALNLVIRSERINSKGNIILSLVLVDNDLIRKLNSRFLKRNRITDVIAFPLGDDGSKGEFGEIIVSIEKAYQEAHRRKIAPEGEIVLYCVHGLLHLLGYDDHSVKDSLEMWERQREILGKIFGQAKASRWLD
ncbi:MAG: rRNA maturation RNase YbeY [Candidatus Brocadiia bacterium]